jgi:hypothetical protein
LRQWKDFAALGLTREINYTIKRSGHNKNADYLAVRIARDDPGSLRSFRSRR